MRIKVIHKKGYVEDVKNDRPICSLPALHKLFTTILYSRLHPRLDQIQAEDQAGCTATIDFMEAFESITHKSIWNALKSYGIEHDYISLLKELYRVQKATVLTDEEGDLFDKKKGTKQGDPLSSLLFNTVLQKALEDDIPRWQKKKVWEST